MEDFKSREQAFTLGLFAGELLMSKGAIQPDFQLDNIGMRDCVPCLVDSADVMFVNLPSGLTKDVIRTIKESIFSLNDNYEDFEHQSYVRAGFLSRTGILGHMVYEDARDNGYSSFLFVEKRMKNIEHSLGRITKWTDVKSTIGEWMQISLNIFNINIDRTVVPGDKTELAYDIAKSYFASSRLCSARFLQVAFTLQN